MRLSPLTIALAVAISATLTSCGSSADTGTSVGNSSAKQLRAAPTDKSHTTAEQPLITTLDPPISDKLVLSEPYTFLKFVSLQSIAGMEKEQHLIMNDPLGIIHGKVYDNFNTRQIAVHPTPLHFKLTSDTATKNHVNQAIVSQQRDNATVYQDSFTKNSHQLLQYSHQANVNFNRVIGLAPVFAGDNIVTSRANQGKFDTQVAGRSKGNNSFTGKGVRIVMIDGEFHPEIFPYLAKQPTEIYYKYVPAGYSLSGRDTAHAIKVANIIAGKRTSTYPGTVPDVDLYYVTNHTSEQEYGKLYQKLYDQYHPAIINLSIRLNDPPSNDIKVAASYNGSYSKNIPNAFVSTYGAVQDFAVNHPTDGSLFVFATGNYDYRKWLQQQVTSGQLNAQNIDQIDFTSYGKQITAKEAVAQFANAPDVDNLVVVTGVGVDHAQHYHSNNVKNEALAYLYQQQDEQNQRTYNQKYTQYQQQLQQYQKEQQAYEQALAEQTTQITSYQKEHAQATVEQAREALQLPTLVIPRAPVAPDKPQPLPKPVVYDALNGIEALYGTQDLGNTLKPELFTTFPGARQCGVTMYSCLAASDVYNFRSQENPNAWTISSGTSYAAPQVSAIAAMVKQQFDFMSASNLKTTLLTTAYDIGKPGVDPVYGWGLVNAYRALRGPAMFAFGDFKVNLGNKSRNYYFTNDISGAGGLIVNGGNTSFLYLTGNNSYTGITEIQSGNLAVVSANTVGTVTASSPHSNHELAIISDSDIVVQNQGNLYVTHGQIRNIYNNGYTQLSNAHITGNLTNSSSGTVGFDISGKSEITGKLFARGNLYLYASQGTGVFRDITTSKNTKDQGVVFVEAQQGIEGRFARAAIEVPALYNFDLYYGKHSIAATFTPKSFRTVAHELLANSSNRDAELLTNAADRISQITATTTSSTSQDSTRSKLIDTTNHDIETNSVVTEKQPSVTDVIFSSKKRLPVATADMLLNPNYDSITQANASTKIIASTVGSNVGKVILSSNETTSIDNRNSTNGYTTSRTITSSAAMALSVVTDNNQANASTALMQQLATLSTPQYQRFLLHTAASPYADVQLATTVSMHQSQALISKKLVSGMINNDQDIHGLVLLNHANNSWHNRNTSVKGHQVVNGFTLGAYTQRQNINYGLALTRQQLTWQETFDQQLVNSQFTLLQLQASQVFKGQLINNNHLGTGNSQATSLMYSQALAYTQGYVGATAMATQYSYQVTRSDILASDHAYKQARFKAREFGINIQAGYQLATTKQQQLLLENGLSLRYYHQASFDEKLYHPSIASSLLRIQALAKSQTLGSATIGLKYLYTTHLFSMSSNFNLGMQFTKFFNSSDFSLNLARIKSQSIVGSHITTAQAFKQQWLASLTAGYQLQVTSDLSLQLKAKIASAPNYKDAQVNLAVDYRF